MWFKGEPAPVDRAALVAERGRLQTEIVDIQGGPLAVRLAKASQAAAKAREAAAAATRAEQDARAALSAEVGERQRRIDAVEAQLAKSAPAAINQYFEHLQEVFDRYRARTPLPPEATRDAWMARWTAAKAKTEELVYSSGDIDEQLRAIEAERLNEPMEAAA